ncbi:MAG TPA: radical SAM protein [Nitrospirae bacterium]|nr:radical SAM protein [Nitrospirota bacterium]HDY99874.1 radical SAM protein [Nitrospirota bacterium]
MNFFELFPKVINYRLARMGFVHPANPIVLTYSVTAACQSNCKTCNIGAMYKHEPLRKEKDLKLDEIERLFKSIGHIFFLNFSGGEPYLRRDLPQIVELACKYLKPGIIHIPTNALMPERIKEATLEMLGILKKYKMDIPLTVKPSIDGVGAGHDEIRGIAGNFDKLVKTIHLLKDVSKEHRNFHLELGTVISNFNINNLTEIEDYVHSLGVESYRNEIAERRAEFFNKEDPITPDADTYERLIRGFSRKVRENIHKKRSLARTTEAFRLVYYELASRIMQENKQVIPCYAGISNVHINFDGEVWPCCVLGYDKPMGNLREEDYVFEKIWRSERTKLVRKYIKDKNCACPLANQTYSNILCDFRSMMKVFKNMLSFFYFQKR